MLTQASIDEVTTVIIIPHTQAKLVSLDFPKYTHHGDCVHSHRRHHHGHYYAHTHQHSGGEIDHDHSEEFWLEQEQAHEVRMSFLSFL